MNKFFKKGELQDKKIVVALRKCADNYENGEILEVRDELVDIVNLILEWEHEY